MHSSHCLLLLLPALASAILTRPSKTADPTQSVDTLLDTVWRVNLSSTNNITTNNNTKTTNTNGASSSEMVQILVGPGEHTRQVGESVVMPCTVDMSDMAEDVMVEWERDGVRLGQVGFAVSERLQTSQNYSLRILNLSLADSGEYRCSASAGGGRASAAGHLTVLGTAPTLTRPALSPVTLLTGDTAVLQCGQMTGAPSPALSWSIAGEEVGRGAALLVSLPGQYTCRASNPLGEDSVTVEVVVMTRTKVVSPPQHSTVNLGTALMLDCKVEVEPALLASLTVIWRRDGVVLPPSFSLANHSLALEVGEGDSGSYWCEATTRLETGVRGEQSKVVVTATTTSTATKTTTSHTSTTTKKVTTTLTTNTKLQTTTVSATTKKSTTLTPFIPTISKHSSISTNGPEDSDSKMKEEATNGVATESLEPRTEAGGEVGPRWWLVGLVISLLCLVLLAALVILLSCHCTGFYSVYRQRTRRGLILPNTWPKHNSNKQFF